MPPDLLPVPTLSGLVRALRSRQQPRHLTYPVPPTPTTDPELGSPADAGAVLGQLRNQLIDLDMALAQLDRRLRRESAGRHLAVVDGPFTGDPAAAVAAAHLWLTQARTATGDVRCALDNAHLAVGGFACSSQHLSSPANDH